VIAAVARRTIRYGLLRTPLPVRSRVEVGLLRAYEAYERTRFRETGADLLTGDLPLPPAKLRVLVCGSADPEYFLDAGRRHAELFQTMVTRAGVDPSDWTAVLDFGVGCGRVARWWAGVPGPAIYGCDPNPELAHWTRAHLPFVNAAVSEQDPPLPYADDSFDFVYALSIFTHLGERHSLPWMAELRRIIKPGGLLLLTVAGEAYRDRLERDEGTRYDRGEEVVQFDTARGTNLCIAYHSPAYMEHKVLVGFELVDTLPASQSGDARMPQDCYLVRVPEA
jgi:SAM-dependent methyltransferase